MEDPLLVVIHTQPFVHVFFEWEGFSLKRDRRVHTPGVISCSTSGLGQSRLWLALVVSHGQPSGRADRQKYMSILLFVNCTLYPTGYLKGIQGMNRVSTYLLTYLLTYL